MVRIEIADGPSEMGLMMSLFRQTRHASVVYFTPEKGQPACINFDVFPVQILALSRGVEVLGGFCSEWKFAGKVISQSEGLWRVVGFVEGMFSTKNRKGWFDFEEN